MSYRELPTSASREVVNALLRRARRFHCSVSGVAEYDVTLLRERLRAARRGGRELSLSAFLMKATARLIEEQPHLNRHQFTGLFGRRRIVQFEGIDCTLVVARHGPSPPAGQPDADGQPLARREELLLPLLVRDVNGLSLEQIEAVIRAARSTPLHELPQWRDLQRIERLPRVALSWLSFKARSDPDFYRRYFGTYGLSSLVRVGGHGVGGATLANTGVAFLPGSLRKQPRFVDGAVVAREILTFGIVFDHFLFDGIQMVRATERLGALLEKPSILLDGSTEEGRPHDARADEGGRDPA